MIWRRLLNYTKYKLRVRNAIIGLRLTVTWKCNSKCATCSIWQKEGEGAELSIGEIDSATRSPYFRRTEYITISGGEPTMRDDLAEVVSVLHRNIPTATFGITLNGLVPGRAERFFRDVFAANPGIRFHLAGVSLNGPRDIHDATRGVPGSWDKAVETYDRIKDMVHTEFSFTFCKSNREYFKWTQDFARKVGTNAYICWTVMNDRFCVSDQDLVFYKPEIASEIDEFLKNKYCIGDSFSSRLASLVKLSPAIALGYLYDSIIARRVMPCFAASQIVHIDPYGNVFPCNFKLSADRNLGNIRALPFDHIWRNVARRILNEIASGDCMYPNGLCGDSDIFPSVCNSPPVVLSWYLKKALAGKNLVGNG